VTATCTAGDVRGMPLTDVDPGELVRRASTGDEDAWRELVDRFGPLLWGVASTYRLGHTQTADAVATAWMRLVEHIDSIRDANRVAGWLVTTVRRECLARLQDSRREYLVDDLVGAGEPEEEADMDRRLAFEEDRRLIRRALAQLSDRERQLALVLFADPSPSYRQIGARFSMPVGSIGPTRARILDKLRRILAEVESAQPLAG
jgi:RNA polymerase sigma factor (sigma-70 family)